MKLDESSPKDGDVSPITQSVVNLPEESKASTSKAKKPEPTSELRPNFSRVTPAQLPYISFPSDGRYQPVRAVSSKTPLSKTGKAVIASSSTLGVGSEKYAGGGGILILADLRPDEPAEFIEIETAAPVAAPAPASQQPAAPSSSRPQATGRHISLDDSAPEAAPPEPFEVSSKYNCLRTRTLM